MNAIESQDRAEFEIGPDSIYTGANAEMDRSRKTSLSLALFVLICFFLPWVQLSCMGLEDSASGFDLAREDKLLWIIPIAMSLVMIAGLVRGIWRKTPWVLGFVGLLGGTMSAYVMYHERAELNAAPRLIATQWTATFWLAFLACLGVAAAAFRFYARSRSP
jgi:hypothetical protein